MELGEAGSGETEARAYKAAPPAAEARETEARVTEVCAVEQRAAEVRVAAARIRYDIISMLAKAGSGHPGGSLSSADIMAALYFGGALRYDATDPELRARDRFILSKGHAAPVLYATLAESGYLPREELNSLRQLGSRLQGHPDSQKLPGVEVSTGSLGQGLSIAAGLALGLQMDSRVGVRTPHVYALLGDGECQEGQVWEAAMFAGHKKLANLTAIIDRNGLQIDGPVADICDVGDLAQKFAAFGWQTLDVDGHDVCALTRAFAKAAAADRTGPLAIVAHTVKGKGVSFMEDQCGWHGKAPGAEQCDAALAEIDAQLAEASDGEQMGETGGGAQGRHGSSGGRDFFGREAACG